MASQLINLSATLTLQYIILIIMIQIAPYFSSYDGYETCSNNLFSCGHITKIGFPFWGANRPRECGHPLLNLTCSRDITYITIKDVTFQVLWANPNEKTMSISRVDYLNLQGLCPQKPVNTSLDTQLFVYGPSSKNLTLFYGCAASNAFSNTYGHLPCIQSDASGPYVYTQFGSMAPPVFCETCVVVPVSQVWVDINDFNQIQKAIRDGFIVRWIAGVEECEKCTEVDGGVCGYDWSSNQTSCYCRDGPCHNESPSGSYEPSFPAFRNANVEPHFPEANKSIICHCSEVDYSSSHKLPQNLKVSLSDDD
ncbi:hypothetical protein RJT34_18677 [Clitoria ternatea]|uniref:non-specific serine/threonine protein kinase n=1 Tax=Clitoria ternatea TaxID=43366 RepID=A0AAN9JB92_CLITE